MNSNFSTSAGEKNKQTLYNMQVEGDIRILIRLGNSSVKKRDCTSNYEI